MLGAEGTVEVDIDQTDLLAFRGQIVDGFLSGLGDRAHGDDNAVGLGMAVVVEEPVFAAGYARDLVHIFLDDGGNGVIVAVRGLAVLEEHVGILGHAAVYGSVGVESAVAEGCESLLVDERGQGLGVDLFDFLDLMGGSETVEEVDERNAALYGCEMGDAGQIHNLLDAAFGEHGEAGLANRHDVLMVAENRKGMAGEGARADVKHTWEQLAGNLIHVGNHQQQSLTGCIGSCQSSCLKRAVNGTGSTPFALHFLNVNGTSEHILAACGRPFIDIFSHCRRRCDGIDGGYLCEQIADMGGCLVAIASQEFLFFTHCEIVDILDNLR